MSTDTRAIYQQTLDKMTEAILDHDVDLWVSRMHLPHFMSTCDGRLVIETERDARVGLTDYHMALRKLNVVRMHRVCDTARQVDEDTIVGFHTTDMIAGNGSEYPSYQVRWVLHRSDGTWKVAKSDSTLSASDWDDIPHNTLSQFDELGGDETKARRMQLQLTVDQLDNIFLSGDFSGLLDNVSFPFRIEARSGTRVLFRPEEMEEDYELYQKEFRIHGVTEMTRVIREILECTVNTARCSYRAHVLNGTNYVISPWDGEMTFERVDGRWRIKSITRAIGHLNWNTSTGVITPLVATGTIDTQPRDDGEDK